MGYGGDLIWTAVVRSVQKQTGEAVNLAYTPRLSDRLRGFDFDRARSVAKSPIFLGNPHVLAVPGTPLTKSALDRLIDWIGDRLWMPIIRRTRGEAATFDRLYARAALRRKVIWMDQLEHSYAASESPDRMHWRVGPHIIDVVTASVLRRLGKTPANPISDRQTEFTFTKSELQRVDAIIKRELDGRPFITFEPDSNPEYFGRLRLWPEDRWVELLTRLSAAFPEITWVQIGLGSSAPFAAIPRMQSLVGKTSFREAALAMERSRLFIGTEGGLVHAARAVRVPGVLIWGGVTRPEFAAYPEHHTIVSRTPECAEVVGCGRKGECPYGIRCMMDITVDDVFAAVSKNLRT